MDMASQNLYIAPTSLRAEELRLEAAFDAPEGVAGVGSIFSFAAFVHELMAELDLPGRAVSQSTEQFILSRVISDYYQKKGDSYFGRIALSAGFARALADFFNELKSALVGCEAWSAIAPLLGANPQKIRELSDLYRGFEEKKRALGLIDAYDPFALLLDRLRDPQQRFPILEAVHEIHFLDLRRINPFSFELFFELGKRVKVTLRLPLFEEKNRSFFSLDASWKKIEALTSYEGQIEPRAMIAEPESPDLAAFLQRLFTPARSGPPLTGVACFQAYSRYREVEEIASRILIDLEQGREPVDIGVIFRDLSVYGPIVEDVFRRFSIPFYFRRGNPLRANPLIKAALTVFDIVDSSFEREQVLKLFTSEYVRIFDRPDGEPPLAPHEIERIALDLRVIQGGSRVWDRRLEARINFAGLADEADADQIRALEKFRIPAVSFLAELERLAGVGNTADFFAQYERILEIMGLEKALNPCLPFGALYRDSMAYRQLRYVLDTLQDEIRRVGTFSVRGAYKLCKNMLLLALDELNIPQPVRSDRNCVRVLSAEDSAGHRFHTAYIGGLIEGEFPRKTPPHPFLREKERRAFNKLYAERYLSHEPEKELGRRPLSLAADQRDEDALLFLLASGAAQNRIVFSYPGVDLGGGQLLRSPFIEDVLQAVNPEAPAETVVETPPIMSLRQPFSRAFQLQELINKTLFRLTQGPDENALRVGRFLAHRYPELMASIFSRVIVENVRQETPLDQPELLAMAPAYAGFIQDPDLLELLRGRVRAWSPTALEAYGECPFSYWISHTLKLEETPRPKMETDPLSLGIAAHTVLELYHGKKRAHALPREERLQCMRALIQEAFGAIETEKPYICGDINFWRILRNQAERVLMAYVDWDEEFRGDLAPLCVELTLGAEAPGQGAIPYLELCEPGEEARVHRFSGKIDRVDADAEGKKLRVWDYKYASGSQKYSEKLKPENFGVISFQVPLYLLAAHRHLVQAHGLDADMDDAGYILLKNITRRDPKNRAVRLDSRGLSAQALWDLLNDPGQAAPGPDGAPPPPAFQPNLFAVIHAIERGEFPARPHSPDVCSWCGYSSVCRFRPQASEPA